jgi:Protein of unknown function (DUF2911)
MLYRRAKGGATAQTAAALLVAAAILEARVKPQSQPSVPQRLSPHETVAATIDGARVVISHGRPSMRGRRIFGALVPYGRVWCPGADEATTFDSDVELRIANLIVPKGPHTIWILPTTADWTLIVSKDPSGFHADYHPDRDLARIVMRKRQLPTLVERLTFAIVALPSGGGDLRISWENTEVSAPLTRVQ